MPRVETVGNMCNVFPNNEFTAIFFSFMNNMLEEIVSNNAKLNLVNVLRGNP